MLAIFAPRNTILMDNRHVSKWLEQKSRVCQEIAQWKKDKTDEVYFRFSDPSCGWMDITVFVNGEKRHTFSASAGFDPFPRLKKWMENIVEHSFLSTDLEIDLEGNSVVFHYEHLHPNPDMTAETGLFYVFDSSTEAIPVACYCETKQLLFWLYNGLIYYASRSGSAKLIGKEWYYLDKDDEGNPTESNWTFYNVIKSPIVEWYLDETRPLHQKMPRFRETLAIKETVHMWAEWGDGLFWHQRGGCCGNAEKFCVDNLEHYIELTDLPELRKWYDEFDDSNPCVKWEEDVYNSWFLRGWELAKEVRKRLPETVDLYYDWKYLSHKIEGKSVAIPFLVLDERLIAQNS